MNIKRYKNDVELFEEIENIDERSKKIAEAHRESNERKDKLTWAIVKAVKEHKPTLMELEEVFRICKYEYEKCSVTEVNFDLMGK